MALFNLLAFVCLLAYTSRATAIMTNGITELGDGTFAEFAKNKDFLMVDFYAPWCSDSKALAPELEKAVYTLGKRGTDVAKVDCFGKGKHLCESFGIRHWPTLKTFRHGIFTSDYTGAHHAEAVANYVNGAEDIIEDSNGFSPEAATAAATAPASNSKEQSVFSTREKAVKTPSASASVSASSTAPAPADKKLMFEEESAGSSDNEPPVAATKEDSQLRTSDQPAQQQPAVAAAPGILPKITATSSAAVVPPTIMQPSAEVVDMLECAKCKILTPAQLSMSETCRAYKKSCLPHHKRDIQTNSVGTIQSSRRHKIKYIKRSHKQNAKKHIKRF